jgi:hypothetical protein
LNAAPEFPRDADVVTEEDLQVYAAALTRNGFFGPDSYYMNHAANTAFVAGALASSSPSPHPDSARRLSSAGRAPTSAKPWRCIAWSS